MSASNSSVDAKKSSSTIKSDPGVYPGGHDRYKHGWMELPAVAGAALDTTSIAVGSGHLTNYVTASYDASKIKRAVIQIHGMNRDSWNQWTYSNLALARAVEGGEVKQEEVVIMAPQFFTVADKGAYSVSKSGEPTTDAMIWKGNNWGDGSMVEYPAGAGVGGFEALDAAINYFLDPVKFPQMVTVVVAGFSLGSQLVQRYSALRPVNAAQDSKINYWICSPNSFLYLNDTRPLSTKKCPKFNQYKYGLDGTLPAYVRNTSQEALMNIDDLSSRVLTRRISYAVGVKDTSNGANMCQADVQGKGHLSKVEHWTQDAVPFLPGSTGKRGVLPSASTVDYVSKVSHQDYRMIQSDPGVLRLFLDDYSARGSTAKAPSSNGLVAQEAPDSNGSLSSSTISEASKKLGAVAASMLSVALFIMAM